MIPTVDFVLNCCTRCAKKCGQAHFSERPESNKASRGSVPLDSDQPRPAARSLNVGLCDARLPKGPVAPGGSVRRADARQLADCGGMHARGINVCLYEDAGR